MLDHELTLEQRIVLDALLPEEERTGNARVDWAAAVRKAMQNRVDNTLRGEIAIKALRAEGLTWRDLEKETGVPFRTAYRWGNRPPGTCEDPPPDKVHLDTAS